MIDTLANQGATHVTLQVVVEAAGLTRNKAAAAALTANCLSLRANCEVIGHAVSCGLEVGAAIVDPADVGPLRSAGARFFKVLSADITFPSLHREVSLTGLPFYLSTGASTFDEIDRALVLIRTAAPNPDVRLIHTVVHVPTPAAYLNLANIQSLADRFKVPVAYGQHSDIPEALPTAIALGAECVFVYVAEVPAPTLPDGPHAVACADAGAILGKLDLVRVMIGSRQRTQSPEEGKARRSARRSIVASRAIEAGARISLSDVAFKRPGTGAAPWDLERVIGRIAERDFAVDEDLPGPSPMSTADGRTSS